MGKFNVTTAPGTQPSEQQSALIDRVQRDASVQLPTEPAAPAAPVEAAPTPTPAAPNPVIDGLIAEGLLAEDDLNQTPEVTEQDFLAEEQRERERIKPLSERAVGFAEYQAETGDPFHAQLERAAAVQQAFEWQGDQPPVVGSYIDNPSLEAFQQGQDPYAATDTDPAKSGVLPTLARFGAAEVDFEGRGAAVNPTFTTVGTMVIEKFLSSQAGTIGDSDVDFGGPLESDEELAIEEVEARDPTFAKRRSQGNERIGRTILQEFLRERAKAEGNPTDTYTTDPTMRISKEDAEFVGGMMKEAYAAAVGPDYITVNKTPGAETVYTPTATGLRRMQKADESAGFPFDNREVAPLLTPPRNQAGQPEFEAATYTRAQTRNVGGVTQKELSLINEARANFSRIPWKIDGTGERILYATGMPAISQAIAMYTQLNSVAGDDVIGLRDTLADPASQELRSQYAFADLMNIGPKRLDSLVGEYTRLQTKLDLKRKEWREATSDFDRGRAEEEGTALAERLAGYNPLQIYRQEVNKFIESMNTISKYQGRANYLTLATQMLTGRMNIQQNKLNPQTNKWVRFALRNANDVATINPHGNTVATRMFKEHGAVLFLPKPQGKYAFPQDRINAFDNEMNTPGSRLRKMARLGGELEAALASPEGARGLFQAVAPKDSDAERVINIPPEVRDAQAPVFSNELMEELRSHDPEEVPYIMEYMMNLSKYAQGKPFRTTAEAEMDGITNGPSSNGFALGIENTMFRAGVLHDGPMKLMRSGDEGPLDLRDQMANDMKAKVSGNGDISEAMADVAYAAIQDKANYLKKPPMTTIYGQELRNLKQHAEAAMFTGDYAGDIQGILKDSGTDAGQAADYLHGLVVDSLTETLNPVALQASRQLRANNVLATLSGEPLYYDNPMGFRGYAAGKATTEEVGKTHLRVQGEKRPVPHYKEEIHGAALRGTRRGGWGHGQIIPAVTQSYDATMIAKSLSGRQWANMSREAKQRGQGEGFLPVFDAGKAGYGKLDLVRKAMNESWSDGITGHSFVESIMGDNGWYANTSRKVIKDLNDHTGPLTLFDARGNPTGKYQGLAALLFSERRQSELTSMVESVYPFEDPKVLANEALRKEQSKKIAQQINRDLNKVALPADWEYGDPVPKDFVLKSMGVILNSLKVKETNSKMNRETNARRQKAFSKIKRKSILQVDLG